MKSIEYYELSDKQIDACKDIVKAFKKAKKLGLSFLAKQTDIAAYKTCALEQAASLHDVYNHGEYLPYYSLHGCIDYFGADDMECFPKGFFNE